MEKVVLKTKDELEIIGDYYNLSTQKRGVLLLHMMPETRKSWWDFALKLEDNGFQVLAIDLRGHGESSFGPDGYKKFSDEDHQKSILDVEAGIEFFKALDILPKDIVLIGASIGANLALKYASENSGIEKTVCLSPGINYRGIKPLEFISKLKPHQKILIVSSEDDLRTNNESNSKEALEIFNNIPNNVFKKIIIYKSAGHGTNMFNKNLENEPDLSTEIIQWIKN
ncbi:MAG: alpha/beta hydrolase [Minisyncoccia bacterium]